MTLYISLTSLQAITGPGNSSPTPAVSFKRGIGPKINLIFLDSGDTVPAQLPNQASQLIEFGIKRAGNYDGTVFLVYTSAVILPSGMGTTYTVSPSFNTTQLDALFDALGNAASVSAILEIAWTDQSIPGTLPTKIFTENVTIFNDVIQGDESLPTSSTNPVVGVGTAIAVAAVGSQTDTMPAGQRVRVTPINVTAFAGTGTVRVSAANAVAGALQTYVINFPATSTATTVSIVDDASGGVLAAPVGTTAASISTLDLYFNGTNWAVLRWT